RPGEQALGGLTAQALPGTEGGSYPFWSPDSRWIAFFASGKLKRIEISGGLVQTLCDAGLALGGTWNRNGVIVLALQGLGVFRVSATGGTRTPLMTIDFARRETALASPSFLPDGVHFLYYIASARKETRGIYVGMLDRPTKQRLLGIESFSNVLYAPPGFLL